jgi:hypothetical protein
VGTPEKISRKPNQKNNTLDNIKFDKTLLRLKWREWGLLLSKLMGIPFEYTTEAF